MQLCSNRPEGFGPHSALHPNLPTTCFIDVIVEPLATWVYLVAAIPILILSFFAFFSRSTSKPANPGDEHSPWPTPPQHKRWRVVTLWVVYAFFIVALIAMLSLEIARLVTAQLGIGLLPFTYVGIVLAMGIHGVNSAARKSRTLDVVVRAANGVYWVLLAVVFALKVAAYVEEGIHSRDASEPVNQYKVVDEVTDVAVMIALVVVLAVLELLWV